LFYPLTIIKSVQPRQFYLSQWFLQLFFLFLCLVAFIENEPVVLKEEGIALASSALACHITRELRIGPTSGSARLRFARGLSATPRSRI